MKNLLLLLVLMTGTALVAQDLFTVRIGVFRDVRIEEFNELQSLGFLYGIPGAEQTTEVFVGHYAKQDEAVTLAEDLRQRGYRNAQAFQLPLNTAPPAFYIQLALHAGKRPPNWSALEQAGPLLVTSLDGTIKILTGPFPDAEAAAAALPKVRNLGYRDAFSKQLDPARLINIGTFETGIKKPLIPISLTDRQPRSGQTTAPVPATSGTISAPQATTYGTTLSPATAVTAPLRGPAPADLPVNGKRKRSSAAELQRLLKEKGYYTSSIDGYYGPGTTAAFTNAWAGLPELNKYRMMVDLLPPEFLGATWAEAPVLIAIADELAAGMANGVLANQLLAQRPTLYATTQPLSPAAAARAQAWAATVWDNLDEWAIEDPLHSRIFTAFRLIYLQNQVRFEDHYSQQGLSPEASRDLATAMLQNLLAARLDRFL